MWTCREIAICVREHLARMADSAEVVGNSVILTLPVQGEPKRTQEFEIKVLRG